MQNAILDILLIMQEFEDEGQDKDELFDRINEIYINLKPKKQDYPTDRTIESLNKKIGKREIPLIETITKENEIKRLSPLDEEENKKQKKRLKQFFLK